MWRPTFTILRKVVFPSFKENVGLQKIFLSTKGPRSASKLTLISASIGVMFGAGYGAYTHYKVNSKQRLAMNEEEEYALLKESPNYQAHYRVRS